MPPSEPGSRVQCFTYVIHNFNVSVYASCLIAPAEMAAQQPVVNEVAHTGLRGRIAKRAVKEQRLTLCGAAMCGAI